MKNKNKRVAIMRLTLVITLFLGNIKYLKIKKSHGHKGLRFAYTWYMALPNYLKSVAKQMANTIY
tara:strand:- start:4 stop:198 length:195 start_codon:yes stop_codon:yes gene_type:complete